MDDVAASAADETEARKSGFACRSSNNLKKASYQFHFAP